MHDHTNSTRGPLIDINRRRVMAAGAGLLAAAAVPEIRAQSRNYGIEGQAAPEIKLDYWIDKNGDPADFSVTENRGKWVFLKCFQNWCPGCHASGFPTLQQFSERFHEHPKVAIAGIQTVFEGFGSNTQADVRKLQKRYDLPIIMGHDPGNRDDPQGDHRSQTMKLYRTGGTPWLIVIDPAGTVVYNHFNVNVTKLIEHIEADVA
ncbi:MAG: TlpA disulfide reductase family protein [Pseudomonadota bacterium]